MGHGDDLRNSELRLLELERDAERDRGRERGLLILFGRECGEERPEDEPLARDAER